MLATPTSPRLTIGVPAYNNARTIAATLDSLLAQVDVDLVIHISDDGSSDTTADICQRYAAQHARVRYERQPANLRYQNFGHLLRSAQTEYFMWAAGDDLWEPTFAARCIAALDADAGAILAVPRVEFIDATTQQHSLSTGTVPLGGGWSERVKCYLRQPADNSRMYGVFRAAPAKRCFPATSFHAYDWAFSLATLKLGRHLELPDVLMHRDLTPMPSYYRMVSQDARTTMARLFPVLPMSLWLIRHGFMPCSPKPVIRLLELNWSKHTHMVRHLCDNQYRPIAAWLALRRAASTAAAGRR